MGTFISNVQKSLAHLTNKSLFREYVALGLIIIGVIARLMPHLPNFSPLGAIALFSGTILSRRTSLIIPLIIMVITDAVIGFHPLILFTYGSYVLIALWGYWVTKKNLSILPVVGSSFVASVLFFIVSNLGVWLEGRLYPHTLSGFIATFIMAIPFFQNTILGDLFFTGIFFGTFALLRETYRHFLNRQSAKQII